MPLTRVLRRLMMIGVIGWLVFLVVLLSRETPPGAASAEELARSLESALNTGDVSVVEELIGDPVSGDAAAVAARIVDEAGTPHEGRWHVTLTGDRARLVISDDRGPRTRLDTVEADGRWRFSPVALLDS